MTKDPQHEHTKKQISSTNNNTLFQPLNLFNQSINGNEHLSIINSASSEITNRKYSQEVNTVETNNESHQFYTQTNSLLKEYIQSSNEYKTPIIMVKKPHLSLYERRKNRMERICSAQNPAFYDIEQINGLPPIPEHITPTISFPPLVSSPPIIKLNARIVRFRTPFQVQVTISIYWRLLMKLSQQDVAFSIMSMLCVRGDTVDSKEPEIIEYCSVDKTYGKGEHPIIEINCSDMRNIVRIETLGFEEYYFDKCICNCMSSKSHLGCELVLALELPHGPYFSQSFVSLTKLQKGVEFKWKGGSRTADELGIDDDSRMLFGKKIIPYQDSEIKEIISCCLPKTSDNGVCLQQLRNVLKSRDVESILNEHNEWYVLHVSCCRKDITLITKVCNEELKKSLKEPFIRNSYNQYDV
ncbi:RRM domain-containing protein [Entamoeba marina]